MYEIGVFGVLLRCEGERVRSWAELWLGEEEKERGRRPNGGLWVVIVEFVVGVGGFNWYQIIRKNIYCFKYNDYRMLL